MKHAVIETGGKQYRVAEGDVIYVEKLDAEAGATVTANVVKNGRGKKVRVYKMKPKKGYQRTQGHRQPYTKVQIETIA